ncbi:hypothetical protein GE115_17350 [Agromyces sp. CFH 90414]|uniref:Regulatory protein RecX n=1 Tax=Agromyces agglutinans TaxID=2662258 RepID=A0A6I2FLV6_9MICO|nr:RecX family transcriptional regulator [Agromyces agglutinans]MRG61628.1 hypothetical protein [Agromyces agglutinans]
MHEWSPDEQARGPEGAAGRDGAAGSEGAAGDARLAPVSYLPWAEPSATGRRSAAKGRYRGSGRPPVDIGAAAAGLADDGPADDGSDRQRDETGAERDARIDRLVVSRLRRSSLSVSEVRAVLVEHGLDDAEVEEWIERYERLGYLDDARLAEQVVHTSAVRRGKGSGAILAELGRRGVDPSAARAALDEIDPELERENAVQVAQRRARQLGGLDRAVATRRLTAFLQRRGYPSEVIREAVAAALPGDRG